MVVPALVALLLATFLGAPIFVAVGGAALILLWGEGVPLASVAVDYYGIATNPTLRLSPCLPWPDIFLLKVEHRGDCSPCSMHGFGQLRGGAAIVTVLAASFFTCFTGASGVTILAIGGLTMPLLLNSGFRKSSALGLVTGGGSAGVLLMPALPLVLYAIVAKVEMEAMFLAGILPAAVMLGLVLIWGIFQQPVRQDSEPFDWNKAKKTVWVARWELALPMVPIGVLFSGIATPVRSGSGYRALCIYPGYLHTS